MSTARLWLTVYGILHPVDELVYLGTECFWTKVDVGLFLGQKIIKGIVEHAYDLRALVVHNFRRLLIPE